MSCTAKLFSCKTKQLPAVHTEFYIFCVNSEWFFIYIRCPFKNKFCLLVCEQWFSFLTFNVLILIMITLLIVTLFTIWDNCYRFMVAKFEQHSDLSVRDAHVAICLITVEGWRPLKPLCAISWTGFRCKDRE